MPHEHHRSAPRRASVAVLTVSDTRTEATDASGALARALLEDAGHAVFASKIVPDDPAAVHEAVLAWLRSEGCDAIVVSGGTGISRRDTTCEALAGLLDKRLDGFGELFRALSFREIGSAAMLSRAVGGVAAGRPLFVVPGSPDAVRLALRDLVLPELGHLLHELSKH